MYCAPIRDQGVEPGDFFEISWVGFDLVFNTLAGIKNSYVVPPKQRADCMGGIVAVIGDQINADPSRPNQVPLTASAFQVCWKQIEVSTYEANNETGCIEIQYGPVLGATAGRGNSGYLVEK